MMDSARTTMEIGQQVLIAYTLETGGGGGGNEKLKIVYREKPLD